MKLILLSTILWNISISAFAAENRLVLLKKKLNQEIKLLKFPEKSYPKTKLKKGADGNYQIGDRVLKEVNTPIIALQSQDELLKLAQEALWRQSQNELLDSQVAEIGESPVESVLVANSVIAARSSIQAVSIPVQTARDSARAQSSENSKNSAPSVTIASNNPKLAQPDILSNAESSSSSPEPKSTSFGGSSQTEVQDPDDSNSSGENATDPTPEPNTDPEDPQPENQAPTATDDHFSVEMNQSLMIEIQSDLLANDTDPEGDEILFVTIENNSSAGGSIKWDPSGIIYFQPAHNFVGQDTLQYTISDGEYEVSAQIVMDVYSVIQTPQREDYALGFRDNSRTVQTLSAISAGEENLYVAFVSHDNAKISVLEMKGLGLRWQPLADQCSNKSSVKLDIWYAFGSPRQASNIVAGFDAETSSAQIIVVRYSGVDSFDPVEVLKTANPLGEDSDASCGNPAKTTDAINYVVSTYDDNALILSGLSYAKYNGHSPVSMTEIAEVNGDVGKSKEVSGLAVQEMVAPSANDYTIDGNLDVATQWSSISLLIKPQP